MTKAMSLSDVLTEMIEELDLVSVVRCKDCKHKYIEEKVWNCPFGLSGGEDFFCAYGAKDGEQE